ncbi:MAG: hypothetical protein L0207_01045 [Chlamydiae bacterium]|nr:hypothetical protein [Chlamydiota bacterium]
MSIQENGKILGSLFAHSTFKDLENYTNQYSPFAQEIQNLGLQNRLSLPTGNGHQEIDRKFSTDYASSFDPGKETNFNALSYQMRGEMALTYGYNRQAVKDFGKAIELGPTSSLPYLQRGAAYFELGEYDKALKDYHIYVSQTPITHIFSTSDFIIGFIEGLPRGLAEGGKGILFFLSNAVIHPIRTAQTMYEAITTLSKLVYTQEWSVLGEAIAPEIHKLITHWDTLSSQEKGNQSAYALGKYGAEIITPGAVAKLIARGVKGAKELAAISKNLQAAEQTLILEAAAELGSGAKVAEVIQAGEKNAFLAKELGFTARETVELKQAGKLEGAMNDAYAHLNPEMQASIQLFQKAENFLKPHKGYMPEAEVRALIHQTGIRTFPKPTGIPENFRVKLSNNGAGMKYVHPENKHVSIRIMPGKPHSPFPYQQKSYVIQMKDGKAIDKFGKHISPSAPEAHIPLEEFIYRN